MYENENKKNIYEESADLIGGIQQASLSILKAFLQICEKNNLKYYLLGGSCLGAVRHQGFIPWDDDIDVGMPRNDYNKFIQIGQKELPKHLFIQTVYTDKYYPYNFAKIRNSETTFIQTTLKDIKMNHGLYIDVFPLDGYKPSKMFNMLNNIYTRRVSAVCTDLSNQKTKDRIILLVLRVLYPSYRIACRKREKLLSVFDEERCQMVANFCGAWGIKEVMPKSYFAEGVKGRFEGLDVVLPKKYDLYLSDLYGDYMEFPPEEKRVTRHFTTVIDLHNSYLNYTVL